MSKEVPTFISNAEKRRWEMSQLKKQHVIDAETWAESGGTAGIFGKLFRQGKLKIVPWNGERIIPNI